MDIPIEKKLRKRAQIELAKLQDEVLEIFYKVCSEKPILHGGTAIWRCFDGLRFSEDLDFYGVVNNGLEDSLRAELESRGLILSKFKKAPHVVYAKISNDYTTVKLEITQKTDQIPTLSKYKKTNGAELDIYALSCKDLLVEKMNAYQDRKFIRDIYDVYFLSGLIDGELPKLKEFLSDLPDPIDEENLKILIYLGVAPSFKDMVLKLKRRSK
jgi:predicted nucleotidyltransferase component of viral defense system